MIPLASYSVPSQSCTPFPSPRKAMTLSSSAPVSQEGVYLLIGIFQSKSISSSAPRLRQEQQRCAAGSALPEPARLCRELHPARSLPPPPPPPSALSCTHPPKPANNPPCTLNPLGQQLGHPILEKEKGKSTGPGRGRTISHHFCVSLFDVDTIQNIFSLGERYLLSMNSVLSSSGSY